MLKINNKNIKKILPIVAYILSPALSFIILPIITKSLNPSEYGIYNYYISIINYALLFSLFPSINSAILRFLNIDFNEYNSDKIALIKMMKFSLLIYLVISSIMIIIYKDWLLVYLVFAYLIINVMTYYKSYLNVNGRKIKFSIIMMITVLCQYLFVFAAYYFFELKTIHLLLGNVVFSIIFISIKSFKNRDKITLEKTKISKKTYNKILKFVIPSIGIALSGVLLSSGDRVIIKNLIENGDYYVGIYAINYTLYAQIIDIIVAIFYLYIPNYLYSKYEKQGLNEYMNGLEEVLKKYMVLTTLVTIVVMFNYDKINFILFDSEYNVTSRLSVYVLIGQHYFGIYRIISSYYSVINKKKVLTYLLATTASINILLNLVFIPIYGYIAAAITTLLCYLLLFIISYHIIKITTKKNLISGTYYILLFLPLAILIFIPEPRIYTNNLSVITDIIASSSLIFIIYGLINYKKIKLIVTKKE